MPTFSCPHCRQSYDATPEQFPRYLGQTITCTVCQKPFTVTGAASPQASPPPPMPAQPMQYMDPFGQPTVPPRPNGIALASLVFGILSCVPLSGIVAIILGILGIRRTREPNTSGKGMAITGIVLGSIGTVLLVPMLIAILLPSLTQARGVAQRTQCRTNMQQIGTALISYASQNGSYPPSLANLTPNYIQNNALFACPGTGEDPIHANSSTTSYIYAASNLAINQIANPAATVLIYEHPENHNNKGINTIFADGHWEWVPMPKAQDMIDSLSSGQNPPRY